MGCCAQKAGKRGACDKQSSSGPVSTNFRKAAKIGAVHAPAEVQSDDQKKAYEERQVQFCLCCDRPEDESAGEDQAAKTDRRPTNATTTA